MGATVWFADMRGGTKQNLLAKIERLLTLAGLEEKVGRKQLVAVKIHFGELGNTAYVRPVYVRRVVERVRAVPVAIDQASLDLVNAQPGHPLSRHTAGLGPGEDKFRAAAPRVDGEIQLAHAQQIGLGERAYTLVTIEGG